MIKLENYEVMGWEHVIRGMRNPMNSWEKSDSKKCGSGSCDICLDWDKCPFDLNPDKLLVGPNDHELMTKLAKGGPVHAKYRRMITVYVDITAPLYWWKEFDTYKVGTVANSCSTLHKIHAKEFTLDDFSHEHLINDVEEPHLYSSNIVTMYNFKMCMEGLIDMLNNARAWYLETKDKKYWWQMIQLLPSSYNQKRTVMLNYEVLHNIYISRKNHKLDEWRELCAWIEKLPYSEIITADTSFQEDLEFFVNDCTDAQLKGLYINVVEKIKEKGL